MKEKPGRGAARITDRPGKTLWLRVEAPHFVAAAAWHRCPDGRWRCLEAAPILKWMRGKKPREIEAYLRGRGWSWSWIS